MIDSSLLLAQVAKQHLPSVFRNIATAVPSIDPFDDVLTDETDKAIARAWRTETVGVPAERARSVGQGYLAPFLYGDKRQTIYVFDVGLSRSRYSDGKFGVWYGALESETSVWESMHYLYRTAKEDLANAASGTIRRHRRMFVAELKAAKAIDLTPFHKEFPNLSHPYDYSLTQHLGRFARSHAVGLFLSPSARAEGGVCVPVFDESCIVGDRPLYEYFVTFKRGSDVALVETLGKTEPRRFPKVDWDKPMVSVI